MKKQNQLRLRHKLHLACGNDDYREALSYVYFQNGMIYATDAHVCVKIPFKDVFDGAEPIEGRCIHMNLFRLMVGKVVHVVGDKFNVPEYHTLFDTQDSASMFGSFKNLIPRVDELFDEVVVHPFDGEIAVSATLIKRVSDAINCKIIKLTIRSANRAILISANEHDSRNIALVMPTMIYNY